MDPGSGHSDAEVAEVLSPQVAAVAEAIGLQRASYAEVIARVVGPLQIATERLTASLSASVAVLVDGDTSTDPLNLTAPSVTAIHRSWLWSVVVGQQATNAVAGKRGSTRHHTPRCMMRPTPSTPTPATCRRRHRLIAGPLPQHTRSTPQSDDPSPSTRRWPLEGPIAWASRPEVLT